MEEVLNKVKDMISKHTPEVKEKAIARGLTSLNEITALFDDAMLSDPEFPCASCNIADGFGVAAETVTMVDKAAAKIASELSGSKVAPAPTLSVFVIEEV